MLIFRPVKWTHFARGGSSFMKWCSLWRPSASVTPPPQPAAVAPARQAGRFVGPAGRRPYPPPLRGRASPWPPPAARPAPTTAALQEFNTVFPAEIQRCLGAYFTSKQKNYRPGYFKLAKIRANRLWIWDRVNAG